MGEIALYKTGINIMDERIKTDRINYFTTYGQAEAESIKAEWTAIYQDKWKSLIESLPAILPGMDKCGCVSCGSYRAANV